MPKPIRRPILPERPCNAVTTNILTEAEFWSDVQLLFTEIEDAIAIFHTAEEINRLAVADQEILRLLDEDVLFWKVQVYSLQASLFIILGRILDSAPGAHSIHKVVNATLSHPEFFSKEALAARKMAGASKPEWLDDYIAKAWAPCAVAELRHLKKALATHNSRFVEVYRPIRHAVYAHRLISNDQAAFELFGKTNRDEVAAILNFLHDLIDSVQDLYVNGIRPELGKRVYGEYNQRIRNSTENVLRKLAARLPADG